MVTVWNKIGDHHADRHKWHKVIRRQLEHISTLACLTPFCCTSYCVQKPQASAIWVFDKLTMAWERFDTLVAMPRRHWHKTRSAMRW
jgi:hypothetical protein